MKKVQQHPRQESKSGKPAYASPAKANHSTTEPRLEPEVLPEVEEKMKSKYRETIAHSDERSKIKKAKK